MRRRSSPSVALAALAIAAALTAGCAGGLRERSARRAATGGVGESATSTVVSPTSSPAGGPASTAPATTAPVCAPPSSPLTSGTRTVTVKGVEREYMVAVPTTATGAAAPVILNFHGSSSNMVEQAAYSQLAQQGTPRGYVVVTPQGSGTPRGWSLRGPGDDDAFVDAILADLATGACIDTHRVYAVGISNGSAYAALLACRAPYRIAAVGMVAATLPSLCPVDHPVPALAFHGTADPVVPYGGGMVNGERLGVQAPGAEGAIAQWAQRNGCGAEAREVSYAADVVWRSWTGCRDDASVEFYSVVGGGHTWPGGIPIPRLGATTASISATATFLDFFDHLPRR
ncbi:MAG: PHB depolymerase family esterase [Acidimicrobiales bacterium]